MQDTYVITIEPWNMRHKSGVRWKHDGNDEEDHHNLHCTRTYHGDGMLNTLSPNTTAIPEAVFLACFRAEIKWRKLPSII